MPPLRAPATATAPPKLPAVLEVKVEPLMPPVRAPPTNTAPPETPAVLASKVEPLMPPLRAPPTNTAPPELLVAVLEVKVEPLMPPLRAPATATAPPTRPVVLEVKVELIMPPLRAPTATAPPERPAVLEVKVELAMSPFRAPPTCTAPPSLPAPELKPLKVRPLPQVMVAVPAAFKKRVVEPASALMVSGAPAAPLARVRAKPPARVNSPVRVASLFRRVMLSPSARTPPRALRRFSRLL